MKKFTWNLGRANTNKSLGDFEQMRCLHMQM